MEDISQVARLGALCGMRAWGGLTVWYADCVSFLTITFLHVVSDADLQALLSGRFSFSFPLFGLSLLV